ncbi:hypothetical protein [Sorangium sp. So ce406]|uniref:hypothetical protein n=1 Tax=Sorangium sp. So ce406 TaxID=3133311 RepID=UPI003F5C6967
MRSWHLLLALSVSAACESSNLGAETTGGAGAAGGSDGVGATGGAGAVGSSGDAGMTSSSSGAGGAGGACTPWSDAGDMCATTVQCVASSAACACDGGAVGCLDAVTFQPLELRGPTVPPPDGACCDAEGMTCGGYSDCGPVCHCQGGAWSCARPAACQPLVCPTDSEALLMLDGTACPEHVGLECPEEPGCTSVRCTCALNPETGTASWRCLMIPC